MSTNCIQCIVNKRTGADLLCDTCRAHKRPKTLDSNFPGWNENESTPPCGSCLTCGRYGPFATWEGGTGVCLECRTATQSPATAEPSDSEMLDGAALITKERQRQISKESWTPEHDDAHDTGDLLQAAAVYMAQSSDFASPLDEVPWPWGKEWWKPSSDPVRNLVKAGALIAAEIDRLSRAAIKSAMKTP